MSLDRPFLDPSAIGEFISFDECPRYHKLRFTEYDKQRNNERNWKEAFEPLSLLFAKDGNEFEASVESDISEFASDVRDHEDIDDWTESQTHLASAFEQTAARDQSSEPLLLFQSRLGLQIEAWPVAGDADIIAIWPTANGIRIRVLDVKAAHEEKPYQQIQVATYTVMLREFLDELSPDYEWELEGGIITRETVLMGGAPDEIPLFDVGPREFDVRTLLREDGPFDEIHQQAPEEVQYQLGSKCESCAYKEACYTDAIEEMSTATLGISIGDQERLAAEGIHTITDLAELAYPEDDPRPYDYDTELQPWGDHYEELQTDPDLGPVIHRYVQRAQAMLGESHGRGPHTSSGNHAPPYLLGSGDGNLPADDPPYETETLPVARGELIRIYLNIQHDSRRDRIVLCSGYVTATNYANNGGDPFRFSEITPDISMKSGTSLKEEQMVLTAFWDQLTDAVRAIAEEMGRQEQAPIHFYFYTQQERTALMEAAQRHADTPTGTALQDLFSLRNAGSETHPEQAMVSILQEEVQSRFSLPIPNPGLMPVKHLFSPDSDRVPNYAWEYTRSDGTTIENLRDAFRFKLFDYNVRYRIDDNGLSLHPNEDSDGWYPSRLRGGAQIPLEYIWAALGQLSEDWVEEMMEDYSFYQSLDPFLWVDRDRKENRIIPEDVAAVGEYLAKCVAHVERGIRYKNDSLAKRPLPLEEVETFSLGDADLAGTFNDFLHLEYDTSRNEALEHLAQPIRQRIQSGEAIPLFIREAEELDDGTLHAEGRLLYDQLFPDDHESIANACRKKATEGSTGGSWMVANELTRAAEPAATARPDYLERGPGVTIEELDIDDHYIELSAFPAFTPRDQEFTRRHRRWTIDEDEADDNTLAITPETVLILDPRTDDLTAQRAYDVIDTAGDTHPLLDRLEAMAAGTITDPTARTDFRNDIETFADWCEAHLEPASLPSPRQHDFIGEADAQFSLLQGPPGTGKTGGSLALAVVARLYAWAQRNHPLIGVVAGESNKAVDEVMEDIADTFQAFIEHPDTDETPYTDVELVRLTNEPPEDAHPAVTYLNYHEDREALATVSRRLLEDARPIETSQSADTAEAHPHTLVFATPARLYKLIDMLGDERAEERVAQRETYFDLLAIDEASMMRLPSFALCSAWLHDGAQCLIAGDHRQMPPVRQHNWEQEDRRPVREYAPFLSTLDWFRALRGDDVSELDDDRGTALAGTASIPMAQLDETYRCHEQVTEFLADNVYAKDGIPYYSHQTATLQDPELRTDGLEALLRPDAPFVVVIHDEMTSRQSNPVEAAIAAVTSEHVGSADSGIVTPHNAQRGLMQARLGETIEVDTVERYQGGQRECILVSATASEPDFLRAEDEFILNPNRLTVAMSRMQHKLIILASEEVVRLIPQDADVYERADLWKRLASHIDLLDTEPRWEGTATDLLPSSFDTEFTFDDQTTLRVYYPAQE